MRTLARHTVEHPGAPPAGRSGSRAASLEARARGLLLLLALGLLAGALGFAFAGWSGVVAAFALALALNVGAWQYGPRLVLRTIGAQPLATHQAPELHAVARELARRAGLDAPTLYLAPRTANALALEGPDGRPSLVLGAPLLRFLHERELVGVLAHETAHLKHRDTLVSAAATLAGSAIDTLSLAARVFGFGLAALAVLGLTAPAVLVQGLVLALVGVLAPAAAVLLRSALSRAGEFAADAAAAGLTGDPEGLARSLMALEAVNRQQSAWAGLFGLATPRPPAWLSTHPSTRERVARLRALP